jgi:hypothetical protein
VKKRLRDDHNLDVPIHRLKKMRKKKWEIFVNGKFFRQKSRKNKNRLYISTPKRPGSSFMTSI